MDFQKLLLSVGQALRKEEVLALRFLCGDLLSRGSSSEEASVLFSNLSSQDHLSPERPGLLTELLLIIQRQSLVRTLNLNIRAPVHSYLISPYRRLLYELYENLTEEDLTQIKFLLSNELPRRKLNEAVTALDVFSLMENKDLLSDTNLTLLESVMEPVYPMLRDKITRFKETLENGAGPYAQDTGRPRSMTYPSEQMQQGQLHSRPLHPENSASCDLPANLSLPLLCHPPQSPLRAMQPSMTSSCMSVDATPVCGGGNPEDLSRDLERLSTVVKSPSLERDEPLTDSEKLHSAAQSQIVETHEEEGLGTYPMTSEKRGICMIINNEDFSGSAPTLKIRTGTKIDEKTLVAVFTWLGFEVEVKSNCTGATMLSVLKELASREELRQTDCLVCCVLSHGTEGGVYGVDGGVVRLRELMEPFSGARCRALVAKPKLFFIGACQGTEEQTPVFIESDSPAGRRLSTDSRKAESIPSDADFLLGMASVQSYAAFRDKKSGTWFIQSLCQNLVKMVPMRRDLVNILTKVNADVSKMTDIHCEKKQMPQPTFSLTKNVIFPVPKALPPDLLSAVAMESAAQM